jgi:phytoene dehydrogenase-like protein
MSSRSAVIIGAGADELVAAHLLARSGWSVLVLAETDAPEWEEGWVAPQIVGALDLEGKLSVRDDETCAAQAIRQLGARDAQKWPEFCARMRRLAAFLEKLYLEPPPDPLGLRFALAVRRLGRQGMEDLMRLLPMPVAELLDEWFESDALKGALGAAALRWLRLGPRSAGTAFGLLHQHVGCPAGVFQPPHSNLSRVLRSSPGITVRAARAAQILARGGRAHGVRSESGEEIGATLVVSGATPRRTLLELADPAWLDPELVRALCHIRARGGIALPAVADSLDSLERAYDETKYRAPAGAVPEAHAELTLDQALWSRPVPELARYRTPIEGLWLCGASMHPGPGIAGAAGYNCVREVLRG